MLLCQYMKTLLTTVLVVAIFSSIGVLVTRHYDNYLQRQAAAQNDLQAAQQAKIVNAVQSQVETIKQDVDAQIEALRSECVKGYLAYEKLTAIQKSTLTAPACYTE